MNVKRSSPYHRHNNSSTENLFTTYVLEFNMKVVMIMKYTTVEACLYSQAVLPSDLFGLVFVVAVRSSAIPFFGSLQKSSVYFRSTRIPYNDRFTTT